MKPSNFTSFPCGSILKKTECEVIAQNVMTILKRTGNEFRPLSWAEYKKERLKDGNFSGTEEYFFDIVIPYCVSSDAAVHFCKNWCNTEFYQIIIKFKNDTKPFVFTGLAPKNISRTEPPMVLTKIGVEEVKNSRWFKMVINDPNFDEFSVISI